MSSLETTKLVEKISRKIKPLLKSIVVKETFNIKETTSMALKNIEIENNKEKRNSKKIFTKFAKTTNLLQKYLKIQGICLPL